MKLFRKFRARLRKQKLDADMSEELRAHLELQTSENLARGMSPDAARHAAQRSFGGVEQIKERCRDERARGWLWLEYLLQDLRYAVRSVQRAPGFAAVVVLTLALGIGANTAIFSAVHSVLLKPLPYFAPGQLYSAEVIIPERRASGSLVVRIQDYLEWREATTAFSAIAAVRPASWVLADPNEPERLGGARVSANFFPFLGVPLRGRGFTAEEEKPGGDRVVIISDGLWRRRFAADPNVVGRTIMLGSESHTVIGIAPPNFVVPTGAMLHPSLAFAPRIDVWKPIAPTPAELQGESWNHGLLVRLGGGASLEQGRQQLQSMLNAAIHRQVPDYKGELQLQLLPLREIFAGKVRERLWLVFAAAALVLAIACSNVAGLFLARSVSRATEFATRLALGAGHGRIARQMLTETLLLAMLGGTAGVVFAWCGMAWLTLHAPPEIQLLARPHPNLPVLLFACAASLVTALACGALPVWQIHRRNLTAGLRDGSQDKAGGRRAGVVRQLLVGTQTAMGASLLLTAALLLQSFINVMRSDRGYAVERVLAVEAAVSGGRYNSAEKREIFFRGLAERALGLPGVQAAGCISTIPATGETSSSQTIFRSDDVQESAEVVLRRPLAAIRGATAGYFAASGTALRAGRTLRDREEVPAAVISESLARRLWPQESLAAAIGRTIRQGGVTGPQIVIVGVVGDVRGGAIERDELPQVYRPPSQWSDSRMTLVLQTSQDPASLAAALRADLKQYDPTVPLSAVRTMKEIVSAAVVTRRFQMELVVLFAAVALGLGMVGVYGLVNHAIASRTREIGVRVALGATRGHILRFVSTVGLKPAACGLIAGLAMAVAIARGLSGYLYEISAGDPMTLGAVGLTLLLSSVLACGMPARRATKVDPVVALRAE